MTLEDAKAHIEYVKTMKPEIFKDLGINENVTDDVIEKAASIATQTHWGAPEIAVETLFNKTLKNLIKES